jgi:hypothetical protein
MNFSVFDSVFPTIAPISPGRHSVFFNFVPTCNFVIDNRVSVDVPGNHAINPLRYFAGMSCFVLSSICYAFLGYSCSDSY